MNGANVGMIERGSGAGFALKTLEGQLVFGKLFGQEFQRDIASQPDVFGQVDHPHAAAAQPLDDAVMRYRLARHLDCQCRGYSPKRQIRPVS